MARADLQELREQLIDTFYLTRAEMGAMKYWGEEKLLETLAVFQAVTEAEQEFESEDDSGFDARFLQDDSGDWYEDDDQFAEFEDGYWWYEFEVVIDYGND